MPIGADVISYLRKLMVSQNLYTEQCVLTIRKISELNTDLVTLPSAMTTLQTSFRAKTSFSHIARLHSMLYAYGATVVEIVRRKEFGMPIHVDSGVLNADTLHSTVLLPESSKHTRGNGETLVRLSWRRFVICIERALRRSNERKRRQAYRNEVQGELPFEVKGLDDTVPSIDFSPSGSNDSPYTLERTDIDGEYPHSVSRAPFSSSLDFLRVLDDLEHFARESRDPVAEASVQEARSRLDKLIGKMDTLESGFDRIAERSRTYLMLTGLLHYSVYLAVLSTSRLLSHRRRGVHIVLICQITGLYDLLATEDEQAYAELQLQLQELQQRRADEEAAFKQSRSALAAEIDQLRDSLQMSETARGQLERDLHAARAQLESEATSRRILEDRNTEMSKEADTKRETLASALAEATEQTRSAEILRQQLTQVKAEYEAMKSLEARNAEKVATLLEDQAKTLKRLEDARARGEDLEAQIQAARAESDDVKRALVEAGKEKDRLLRAQASEHDRLLRDHIAEADGDRAVLEHQFSELRAALEDAERQLKDARAQAEMANADAVGLREELQRVEHELRDARRDERAVREDLRAGRASQADFEHRLEQSERLVAQMLDVALAFRDAHVKALSNVQAMITHPGNRASAAANLADSSLSHSRHAIVAHSGEPAPIDPSDPVAALDALRAFDHDHFLEVIGKAGSTIRKWQKQCKDYRERAKGKISFRNFAKGDLALFLPTRNSISKPWAAFNGESRLRRSVFDFRH